MEFLVMDKSRMTDLNRRIHNDPVAFAKIVLGITLHDAQITWIRNANKRINILRPGNRWGKTLVAAIKHIWHCMCKPALDGKIWTHDEWRRVEYNTLNFGPTYELGKGALSLARDICEGSLLLPTGRTNQSMLKGWAIVEDRSDAQQLPNIVFKTGAKMLGRSMSEMGAAFKMRKLAFITGDECADIPDLWTFTNNTLLMRVVDMDGSIDLVGTPQPEGYDYMRMIEMAEEDMKRSNYKTDGIFYTQRGTVYENNYLPKGALADIERIADPTLREQIIRGEFVEVGDKYFGYDRISNAVQEYEMLHEGIPGRKYITSADFAGGESVWADFTVILTIDYTTEPYKIVHIDRFKGSEMPIPVQYKLTEDIVRRFNSKLIIDSSALGGKNALAFLGHLNAISADFGNQGQTSFKQEMLTTLKIAFDGGQSEQYRRSRQYVNDTWIDLNPTWGLIKIPNYQPLINELNNYKMDDKKLRQDTVMALAMAIHWIEMRRPKHIKQPIVDFDFLE